MSVPPASPLNFSRLRTLARVCAVVPIVAGLVVLLGWWTGELWLSGLVPGVVPMKANTALCGTLMGAGLLLLTLSSPWPKRRLVIRILSGLVFVLAGLTLLQYPTGHDFGTDQWLVRDPAAATPPGRMAAATSAGFVLAAAALGLLTFRAARCRWVGQTLALLAGFNGLLAFVGFFYGATELVDVTVRIGTSADMGVHIAAIFMLLSTGLMLAQPNSGLIATFTSRNLGGLVARRALPFAIVLPLWLGWLLLRGEDEGWSHTRFGLALFAVGNALLFSTILWLTARWLNRADMTRRRALSRAESASRQTRVAHDQLRQRETLMHLALSSANAGTWYWRRDDKRTRGSNLWLELYGFPPGSEPTDAETSERVFPADRPRLRAAAERAFAELTTFAEDYRVVLPDGTLRWLSARGRAHNENGWMQMEGVTFDITPQKQAEQALKESEARFRQLAENIDSVFWIMDPRTEDILYVSPAYDRVWGQPGHELLNSPQLWLDAVHHTDRDRVLRSAIERLPLGTFDETYRIVRPDGSVRWIHDRSFPIRDESGTIYRVVGTATDITAHRELEEQYRHAQKMEAMGTLAGGIAHDFNNILAAINGYTELAKQEARPDQTVLQEHLTAVSDAGQRATDLVRQILTFSRREQHHLEVLRLGPVVREALKLLRASLPATIDFDVSLGTGLPLVRADPTQIHQVLMNLGTNAWHAMRDRPGRLTVKLEGYTVADSAAAGVERPPVRPGRYVRMIVSDTGHGMSRETLARIFEPFFTTKAPGEGTGLGLSVVHGIMDSHGGAVTVKSQPGRGTTFFLYFPAVPMAQITEQPAASTTPVGNGERVMVLDDEAALAILSRKALLSLGYTAEAFTNAGEALEKIRHEPDAFQVVVTDYAMTGMTGIDFARAVHRQRRDLPVVLVSGQGSIDPVQMRAGDICELVTKPHTIATLGAAVHRALSWRPAEPPSSGER